MATLPLRWPDGHLASLSSRNVRWLFTTGQAGFRPGASMPPVSPPRLRGPATVAVLDGDLPQGWWRLEGRTDDGGHSRVYVQFDPDTPAVPLDRAAEHIRGVPAREVREPAEVHERLPVFPLNAKATLGPPQPAGPALPR